MITFKGDCMGVSIESRGVGDLHACIAVLIEDDEEWFEKLSVSSCWLPELIEKLQDAQRYLEQSADKEEDGFGGYRLRKEE